MKAESIRPDAFGVPTQSVGPVLEATAVNGKLLNLFRGQQLTATVVEANKQQVLLNLQGALVAVPASANLKPGAELHVRVASVAPQLQLEVIQGPARPQVQLPPLALGQEVEVDIIERLPNGHALIRVQGTTLAAEVASGVPIGTRVQATVEHLDPQLLLRLSANAEQSWQAEAIHLLRNTVAHRVPEGESLQTLLPALATLIEAAPPSEVPASAVKLHTLLKALLPDTAAPTAERLATFIRDGGLQYEAKLLQQAQHHVPGFVHVAESDVKGLLLQTLKDLGKLSELPPEEQATAVSVRETSHQQLVSALTTHVEHIENQQAVNLLAHAQGEPYQFQIPLFTDQGVTTAFVAINAEGGRQEEATEGGPQESDISYNILFLLDLEGLGQTRIDARIGSKSLWGAFYVDQPESVALLQAELPAFRAMLQLLGYDEVLLLAKPLGQLSPEKRQKFDALAGGVPGSIHLLDVKA